MWLEIKVNLVRMFSFIKLPIEQIKRFLDLPNFLHKPVIGRIATQLNIRTVSSGLQAGLRDLERSLFVTYGFLELLDVLFLDQMKFSP